MLRILAATAILDGSLFMPCMCVHEARNFHDSQAAGSDAGVSEAHLEGSNNSCPRDLETSKPQGSKRGKPACKYMECSSCVSMRRCRGIGRTPAPNSSGIELPKCQAHGGKGVEHCGLKELLEGLQDAAAHLFQGQLQPIFLHELVVSLRSLMHAFRWEINA